MKSGMSDYFLHIFITSKQYFVGNQGILTRRLFYLSKIVGGGECPKSVVKKFRYLLKKYLNKEMTHEPLVYPDKYVSNEVLDIGNNEDNYSVDIFCNELENNPKKWALLNCRSDDADSKYLACLILDNQYTLDII